MALVSDSFLNPGKNNMKAVKPARRRAARILSTLGIPVMLAMSIVQPARADYFFVAGYWAGSGYLGSESHTSWAQYNLNGTMVPTRAICVDAGAAVPSTLGTPLAVGPDATEARFRIPQDREYFLSYLLKKLLYEAPYPGADENMRDRAAALAYWVKYYLESATKANQLLANLENTRENRIRGLITALRDEAELNTVSAPYRSPYDVASETTLHYGAVIETQISQQRAMPGDTITDSVTIRYMHSRVGRSPTIIT